MGSLQQDVITFWFEETQPAQWWTKDPAFDQLVAERFTELHRHAAAGELCSWRDTADGRLAEVIVLDQFSRNMFRDQARAFAFDAVALVLAQEAVRGGHDRALPPKRRAFLYLPYMHSESLAVHDEAERLFETDPELAFNLDFERKHRAILDRFGRYPHRNAVLGRASTKEEVEFLRQPGSSF